MGCSSSAQKIDTTGKLELLLPLPNVPLQGGETEVVAPDGQILQMFVPAGYSADTMVKVWFVPLPTQPEEPSGKATSGAPVQEKAVGGAPAAARGAETSGVVVASHDDEASAPRPRPARPEDTKPLVATAGESQTVEAPTRQQVEFKIVRAVQKGFPALPAQLPRIDGTWDWIRRENDQLHRVTRVDASECLREAFGRGGYCISQGKVTSAPIKFSCIPKMIAGTRLLSVEQGLPKLPKDPHHALVLEYGQGITPIEKAETMALGGFSPATVSAASAYHAGGGFTSGGRHALEEAFCSQSTLYPSLEKAAELWKAGVTKGLWRNSSPSHAQHIPTDGCILSPHVEIFRGNTDQGYFAHNRTVPIRAVVSVAMYNKNPRVRDSPLDAPSSEADYEQGVRSKFTAMVHAAALAGADAIIVPDVGCGVFQNDPHICGRVCGEVLYNYASRFRRCVFTGNRKFFDSAQAAISKASAGGIAPITADVEQRGSLMPVDSKAHLYIGKCAVCGRGLDGVDFNNLAILLDKSLKSTQMQFLHDCCVHGARSKFPHHQTMMLPDITRNAKSFFRALDLNGNGFIEKEELRCVCALLWEGDLVADPEAFERDFDARFEAWDADQTGHVNVKEVTATSYGSTAPKTDAGVSGAPRGAGKPERTKSTGLCVETMAESSCIEWFQEQAKKRQRACDKKR